MLDKSSYDRIHGEPRDEYIIRITRQVRLNKMYEVRKYLLNVRANGMPYDENLFNALEALVEIVDDIIEEGFV